MKLEAGLPPFRRLGYAWSGRESGGYEQHVGERLGSPRLNAWNFDIWFTGTGDAEFATAQQIVAKLAEQDGRVADAVGARWPFDFGMTQLDQAQAITEVERLLTAIDEAALDLLSVRPPG